MTNTQDITEVEWQFDAADSNRVAEWLSVANIPGYTVARSGTKNLRDLYIDSADWRLHRARLTGRVRAKGDGYELTLKGQSTVTGGLRQRREMTEKLSNPDDIARDDLPLTAASAPGDCGNAIRLVIGTRPLLGLFTIATNRQIFILSDGEGRLAEIAVDSTTALPPGQESTDEPPLQRIEVEVEPGGTLERAQRFVDVFVVGNALQPADISKFEYALKVCGLATPVNPPNFGPQVVAAEMTAAEAGYAIMRKQFSVFLANEGSTRWGDDIEGLHDMRVAARRLRAAMSAFREYLPPVTERHRMELGWVAAALGEVRDLDVQIERMSEWRESLSEANIHALDSVEAIFVARRNAARKRMLRALDSRRYDIFVERFARFLRAGPPRNFVHGRMPIGEVAPLVVGKRYRQFRRQGDKITPASPPYDYHELRILGKKLRYALEFVAPVYGEPLLEFSRGVTAIQDILGLHQDADVAVGMLEEMARSDGRRLGPDALMAMGAVAEGYRRHAVELRGATPAAYAKLKGKSWQRVQKLMEKQK